MAETDFMAQREGGAWGSGSLFEVDIVRGYLENVQVSGKRTHECNDYVELY
jgi:hypothetical protein